MSFSSHNPPCPNSVAEKVIAAEKAAIVYLDNLV
jgi:hypothetical protein